MVNAEATSRIIRDAKKLKNYNQTFQLENYYIELADGTKTICVVLKKDAKVCLLDVYENLMVVTLKKALLIPSYLQDIFYVNVTTTVIFKGKKVKHDVAQ